MRKCVTTLGAVALLAAGYLLGSTHAFSPARLMAQAGADKGASGKKGKGKEDAPEPINVSEETRVKIKAASDALAAAMDALKGEGRYNPATKGLNAFSIFTGGGDCVKDLDGGRGVDPETFAALYADLAIDELADKLSRDQEGRLTYNNKVIRMYPVSRLKSAYAVRAAITGEELFAKEEPAETTEKKPKKKPAAKPAADEEKEVKEEK